jgi:hypothetical protein
MDWTPLLQPAVLTPTGLLALTILFIYLGKLVPIIFVRHYLAEIEHQRGTIDSLVASVAKIADSMEAQVEAADLTEKIMRALQLEAQRKKQEEES